MNDGQDKLNDIESIKLAILIHNTTLVEAIARIAVLEAKIDGMQVVKFGVN